MNFSLTHLNRPLHLRPLWGEFSDIQMKIYLRLRQNPEMVDSRGYFQSKNSFCDVKNALEWGLTLIASSVTATKTQLSHILNIQVLKLTFQLEFILRSFIKRQNSKIGQFVAYVIVPSRELIYFLSQI